MVGGGVPTINLRIDYLKPAVGDALIAKARVRRAGKTVAVVDIDVSDENRTLMKTHVVGPLKYAKADNFFFLGRGYSYPTALEGAPGVVGVDDTVDDAAPRASLRVRPWASGLVS